jgi:hypothetical protein
VYDVELDDGAHTIANQSAELIEVGVFDDES